MRLLLFLFVQASPTLFSLYVCASVAPISILSEFVVFFYYESAQEFFSRKKPGKIPVKQQLLNEPA
jgi:hypothetical protein